LLRRQPATARLKQPATTEAAELRLVLYTTCIECLRSESMGRVMDENRKRLLIALEQIVGNEFYNANIQNWGPGGVFEGEGRAFRYAVTFRGKDGKAIKTKHIDPNVPAETLMTGMYKLGATELSIMRALDQVVSYLEKRYRLDLKNH
jgi:hypothetical protein